jgi:hypothetical protein
MQMVVTQLRGRLVRVVTNQRGLTTREDSEALRWGMCVRANAVRLATGPGTVEALAEEVMRRCATEEAAERAHVARTHDAVMTDQMVLGIVATLRDAAVRLIQQARANGNEAR